MSLNRRQIRKRLINDENVHCQSHVDGSLSVFTQDATALVETLQSWGYEPIVLPTKIAGTICVAMEQTVVQGRLGQQHYRGPGEFALTGERAEAYIAAISPEPEEAEEPEVVEAPEPEPEAEVEAPTPSRRSRRRQRA
jgi:hypothetical protein